MPVLALGALSRRVGVIVELRVGLRVVDVHRGVVLPFIEIFGSVEGLADDAATGDGERADAIEGRLPRGSHALEFETREIGEIRHAGLGAWIGGYLRAIEASVQAIASPITW